MVQLGTIESDLIEMGYQIIAISPDSPRNLRKTMTKKKLNYTLLSDSKVEGAKAFGLAFKLNKKKFKERAAQIVSARYSGEKHGILPVPAVFLIGTDEVVDFVYYNPDYTVRLQADEVLKAAKREALKK